MKTILLDWSSIQKLYRKREATGHKGTFGKVLCIGGSDAMQGALALAAQAATRSGAGTVTCFAPESAAKALRAKLSLEMILSGKEDKGFFSREAGAQLEKIIDNYDVLLVGNGIGLEKGPEEVVKTTLESNKPLIIDGDGISLAARLKDILLLRTAPTILTPHVKEAARFFEENPVKEKTIETFVQNHPNFVILYKASTSIIYAHKQKAILNYPNSSLAKGGSGDTLAGMAAGLWPYQRDGFQTCALAAFLHNQAARDYPNNPAFTPEDGLNELKALFNRLQQGEENGD